MEIASKSVLQFNSPPQPIARLYCFHWAGGNANAFKPWGAVFAQHGIELRAIMLPGRLTRGKEPVLLSVQSIVDALIRDMVALQLLEASQPPSIFFGHSLGGLIAFELARQLQSRNLHFIAHLIISCTNNPHTITERARSSEASIKKFHHMTDEALFNHIVKSGGLQAGVHPDFLRLAIPLIKADYTALETYTYTASTPLQCGVTVFGGDSDKEVSRESLFGWREGFADKPVETHIFRGNHFYFQDAASKNDVLATIRDICLKSSAQF